MMKRIKEAEKLPHFQGVAWYEFDRHQAVLFPVPFNFVVGWIRQIYYRLLRGPSVKWETRMLAYLENEYNIGFKIGYEQGLHEGLNPAKRKDQIVFNNKN